MTHSLSLLPRLFGMQEYRLQLSALNLSGPRSSGLRGDSPDDVIDTNIEYYYMTAKEFLKNPNIRADAKTIFMGVAST